MFRLPALLTAFLLALSPLVQAADTPATPEAWLNRMLDAKRNGAAFKDPEAFTQWLDAVTEPRFMTALAAVAANPTTYPRILSDAIDPAAVRNWAEFTDPRLYLRWMLASGNPVFQRAIISKLSDPAKYKRWQEALSQPILMPVPANYAPDTVNPWLATQTRPSSNQWLTLPADKLPAASQDAAARQRY